MNKIHYHVSIHYYSLATIFICLFSNFYMLFNAFSVINIFFNNVTESFQTCKLGLEKAEKPEIKLPKYTVS